MSSVGPRRLGGSQRTLKFSGRGRSVVAKALAIGLCLATFVAVPAPSATATTPVMDLGIYNWNVDLSSKPSTDTRSPLEWASDKVAATGARTTRIYLGSQDIYKIGVTSTESLVSIASRPQYMSVLGDSRYDHVMLTVFDAVGANTAWSNGLSTQERTAVTAEVRALVSWLATTFPTKRFTILNWEGDNALLFVGGSSTAWQGFRDWLDARSAGFYAGLNDAGLTAGGRIKFGVEFNKVDGCDNGRKCVLTDIAPYVPADIYSYSSWSSIKTGVGAGTRITSALNFIYNTISAQKTIAKSSVILGEFGLPREIPNAGECFAATVFDDIVAAAQAWGVKTAIFWQILDNPSDDTAVWNNFGLIKFDGTPTLVLPRFQAYANSTTAPTITGLCPFINTSGVVNALGGTSVYPGDFLSFYGQFAATGNVVHIEANNQRYTVTAGSNAWYESTTQINAKLPTSISGRIVVYVTSNGRDTNGAFIDLAGATPIAPTIPIYGVTDGVYASQQVRKGDVITVLARGFSFTGNRVELVNGNGQVITVTSGSSNWYESPRQINFTLPTTVVAPLQLRVVNSANLVSNVVDMQLIP